MLYVAILVFLGRLNEKIDNGTFGTGCCAVMVLCYIAGARYRQVNYGLLIRNITDEDNGIYTCAAEVQSTGALSQRDIEVIVYCKFTAEFF